MSQELLGRDKSGAVDYTLAACISGWSDPLTANVVVTTTTPAGFNRVYFSAAIGTNIWVTMDGSTPSATASGASTQELNPGGRYMSINGGTTLKIVSDTASAVTLRYDIGS